jgi:hypothetical protein
MGPNLEQGIQSVVYETPHPGSAFDRNIFPSPTQPGITFDVSDDQPYPVYGWMTVGWKRKAFATECGFHPSPLATTLNEVLFFPTTRNTSQLITITNPTSAPIQLGSLTLEGNNPGYFLLHYHDIFRVLPGSPQPPEDCSNRVLQPNGSCAFRVSLLPKNTGYNVNAVISIPGGGPCPIKIPVREVNGVN